jgi:hypothetical protein
VTGGAPIWENRASVRRSLTWLVTLPLAFGSAVGGHDLAAHFTALRTQAHAAALAASGQSQLLWLPYALGALATFLVVGLLIRVLEAAAGAPRRGGAGLGIAAVPVLVFVLQEHIAQLLSGSYAQLVHVSLEPRFALGLLLQLPCGLLACLIARLLLRAAEELGFRLRGRQDDSVLSLPGRPPWAAVAVDLPRVPVLALGYGERGPPRA